MVDWAINISHPSVNNHYCLFTSLLQGAQRWLSFFVSHKALYFIDLPSTLHNFMLFQKSTHHLLMFNVLKKKKRFSFLLQMDMFSSSHTDLDLPISVKTSTSQSIGFFLHLFHMAALSSRSFHFET